MYRWGCSAIFVDMIKNAQDEIIRRDELGLQQRSRTHGKGWLSGYLFRNIRNK